MSAARHSGHGRYAPRTPATPLWPPPAAPLSGLVPPAGATGATGATGTTGASGATGAPGATGAAGTIVVEQLGASYAVPRSLGALLRRASPRVVRSLDDVTLSVAAGEVFGLVGINGAGKTTLIKILSTMLLPCSGRALVGGLDVRTEAAAVRRLIGFVSSNERSFYWRLSARQNLRFFAVLYRVPRAGLDD